jgi:hypothetical protein
MQELDSYFVGYNSNKRKYKKDIDALANYFDSMSFQFIGLM